MSTQVVLEWSMFPQYCSNVCNELYRVGLWLIFLIKFSGYFLQFSPVLDHFRDTHSLDINECPLLISKKCKLIPMKNAQVMANLWQILNHVQTNTTSTNPTMLHISWKFGQKILITTRVINISSHVFECYTLYGARPYKEGTINSDHPVYGKK